MTFKVSSEDTGGAYLPTDSMMPPQSRPPHYIYREDEAFWALEGELEIVAGGETSKSSAGSFHLPKGIPHACKNLGARPARFLTSIVPAGLERFFEEVGKLGTDPSSPPPFEEVNIDKLSAFAPIVRCRGTASYRPIGRYSSIPEDSLKATALLRRPLVRNANLLCTTNFWCKISVTELLNHV